MKTTFRRTTPLWCLASALLFGVSAVRADDSVKKRRHRHPTTAQQTPAAQKSRDPIPTRDDRHAQEVQGGAVGGANGPEYRVRTGSMIPQHYNRRGYTTDSPDNVFIYDKNDQRLRQSDNVSDSLRTVPGVSVGRR